MKTYKNFASGCFFALFFCANGVAEEKYTRLDSQALEEKRRAMLDARAARKSAPVERAVDRPAAKPADLLSRSTLLAANGHWTLVPRGAILHLPDAHAKKIVQAPVGKFLPFHEFHKKNYAWLSTREVSIKEAVGDKPFDEQVKTALVGAGLVVVSTMQKSPTSTKNSHK